MLITTHSKHADHGDYYTNTRPADKQRNRGRLFNSALLSPFGCAVDPVTPKPSAPENAKELVR